MQSTLELVPTSFSINICIIIKKLFLNKVLSFKQQFTENINGNIKQTNIKNCTYYVFNHMINILNFDSSLLKIDKKSFKNIDIYYIGYITIKKFDDYEIIYSVNPLYLIIGEVDGFIEEKNKNKNLVFDSTDGNKEVLKKYTDPWDGNINETETINGGKVGEYGKDFMKIEFNSDNSLALNKLLKLHMLTKDVRSAFEVDGKYYPQIYIDECLYEL